MRSCYGTLDTARISFSKKVARHGGYGDGHDVGFGSLVDICAAKSDVGFTPNSDRESGFPQKVMSALTPKADMCDANKDVR